MDYQEGEPHLHDERPSQPPPIVLRAVEVPERRSSCLRKLGGILFTMVFVGSILLNIVLLGILGTSYSRSESGLQEAYVSGPSQEKKKVAIVPVKGAIFEGESSWGLGAYSFGMKALKTALNDDSVAAVVLEVNSPGGSVTASDRLCHEITQLAAKKPVVVFMGDIAASGGYYISAPAKVIYASPTTITGSIGVIVETLNAEQLMEKIGVKMTVVKSGPRKDVLSPWRSLTEGEQAMLSGIVGELYEQFLQAVLAGRKDKITREKLLSIADGSIFTADQALKNGLIDKIGYREDAIKEAGTLAGIAGEPLVVEYRKTLTLLELLAGAKFHQENSIGPDLLLRLMGRSPFLFMWVMPQGSPPS